MTLSNATFSKSQVTRFLDTNFPDAAEMFAEENLYMSDDIPSTVVRSFFESYFPLSVSKIQYRILEATCVQKVKFEIL